MVGSRFNWNGYVILFFMLAVICVITLFQYYNLEKFTKELEMENSIMQHKLDSFEMYYYDEYGHKLENEYGLWGLAFPDKDIFCVYTKDRDVDEIINTCYHEIAHTNFGLIHPKECQATTTNINE